VGEPAITSLHGLALCPACDRVWYSAAFLRPDDAAEASCQECGDALEPVSAEPFGEGPLFVPADWAAPGLHH